MHHTEELILAQLSAFFLQEGFEATGEGRQFNKNNASGSENIVISCVTAGEILYTEIHLGIRIHAVEQLVQPFLALPLDFRNQSHTLLVSQATLSQKPYLRHPIHSDTEATTALQDIRAFMQSTGFAFLAQVADLQALHQILNDKPTAPNPYFYNQVHYCFKGLAVAFLAQPTDFQRFASIYTTLLGSLHPMPHQLRRFELFIQQCLMG